MVPFMCRASGWLKSWPHVYYYGVFHGVLKAFSCVAFIMLNAIKLVCLQMMYLSWTFLRYEFTAIFFHVEFSDIFVNWADDVHCVFHFEELNCFEACDFMTMTLWRWVYDTVSDADSMMPTVTDDFMTVTLWRWLYDCDSWVVGSFDVGYLRTVGESWDRLIDNWYVIIRANRCCWTAFVCDEIRHFYLELARH